MWKIRYVTSDYEWCNILSGFPGWGSCGIETINSFLFNTLLFSTVKPVLPNLKIGKFDILDRKLGKKVINAKFKSILYHDYDKERFVQDYNRDQS